MAKKPKNFAEWAQVLFLPIVTVLGWAGIAYYAVQGVGWVLHRLGCIGLPAC